MRKRHALAGALLVLLAAGAAAAPAAQQARAHEHLGVGAVAPGERALLVTFADRPDPVTVAARLAGLGRVERSLPEIGVWALHPSNPAVARVTVLRRPNVVRAEWSLARRLDALTDRRPAPAPPRPLLTLAEPTDPVYAQPSQYQQWGLRMGTWTPGLAGYDRPLIAILDSGVDSTHEEWRNGGVLVAPRSTLRNTNTAEDVAVTGHGTHVAGIAAAPANGVGVVGVAPVSIAPTPPGTSRVIPVQIADALGRSTDLTMMRGIVHAVNNGAKVINISSGGPGYTQAFQDTINWAFKRGALVIASVGNEGLDDNPVNFPAGYDHVIGVGAQCDAVAIPVDCPLPFARARFSNTNYSVDVLAPGVNIASSVPVRVTDRAFAPGYALKDGTSMAAPFVAGVVALIYAANPGITPYQVTRILQRSSSRAAMGRTSSDGWGAVNTLAAVQAPPPVDDLSEPNDDVKWLPKRDNIRPTRSAVRLQAYADYNDDPFDVYPVLLRRGERMRVTIVADAARLGVRVFRPGTTSVSPVIRTAQQLNAKSLGATRFTTPGARAVVVRARENGRHYIAVQGLLRGDDYTLKIQRL